MRVLFLLVLTAVTHLAFSQANAPDSLRYALNQHPQEDSIRVKILNDISDYFKWIDFFASQQYAEQSLAISKQIQYEKGTAIADVRIAHCYWALGENELAVEKGLEAAEIAERRQFKSVLGDSYQVLARAYLDQRDVAKAETYIAQAEKMGLETENWDLLSRVYNFSGVVEFVKDNKDSALFLYTKALSIIKEHPTSKSQLSQVTSNIGECYLPKNPNRAFDYFREALAISKATQTRNKSAEASISSIMGHALVKQGNYREAEKYLVESLELSRELGLKRSVRHAYSGLVNLKIQEGKADEALVYLRKYYEVHDSIINVTRTRQIVELETKHQLEKKELAIQLLERDNRIQALWRNILITALISIAVMSVAIYYLRLFREKKNLEILNLQIDNLTAQHKELSEKYKDALTGGMDEPVESNDQRLLKDAIRVVEDNISNPSFGVEQMAREMGMSRTNMHRKLKGITGFAPGDLIRNIRLRKAASLLLHQADSVSQISFKVGFEDHSYFSKSFKKQYGVSPSDYLQHVRQQSEKVNQVPV